MGTHKGVCIKMDAKGHICAIVTCVKPNIPEAKAEKTISRHGIDTLDTVFQVMQGEAL